jgi:hypothetical protein
MNAQEAYDHALNVLKAPFQKGEHAISQDPCYAHLYALNVLKAPFPAGEHTISRDPWHAFMYARYVLKAPFPEGEQAILSGPHADEYKKLVFRHNLGAITA